MTKPMQVTSITRACYVCAMHECHVYRTCAYHVCTPYACCVYYDAYGIVIFLFTQAVNWFGIDSRPILRLTSYALPSRLYQR